jgi:hypothetical protein
MGDLIKTGVLCTRVITVFDTDGITPKTGLVSSDFTTKNLTKDGAVDATAVTVTEINSSTRAGRYKVTWTPGGDGEYELRVAVPTYADRGFIFEFTSTADGVLTLALIQAYLDANSTKLAHLDADISTRATASALATVQADTDDIQTRLPAALVGGKMDSHVNDIATDAITAAAVKADAVTEIQAGLATSAAVAALPTTADIAALDADVLSRVATADARLDNLDAAVSTRATPADIAGIPAAPTSDENADAFLDRAGAIDGKTPREAWQIMAATTAGKSSGDPGSPVFKGLDGSTPRVSASIDSSGNRIAVAYP